VCGVRSGFSVGIDFGTKLLVLRFRD